LRPAFAGLGARDPGREREQENEQAEVAGEAHGISFGLRRDRGGPVRTAKIHRCGVKRKRFRARFVRLVDQDRAG
jgi:hypothetical protein